MVNNTEYRPGSDLTEGPDLNLDDVRVVSAEPRIPWWAWGRLVLVVLMNFTILHLYAATGMSRAVSKQPLSWLFLTGFLSWALASCSSTYISRERLSWPKIAFPVIGIGVVIFTVVISWGD